jgi:predicted Zn finger-like uncharacterized protein
MNVEIYCPHCNTAFTVRRELLGKRTKCTNCGTAFVIAEAAPPARHQPAPASRPTIQQAPPASPVAFEELESPREATAPPPIQIQTAARPSEPTTLQPFTPTAAPASRRFAVLQFVARVYEVLAVLALLGAAIFLAMFIIAVVANPQAILGAIVASGFTVFWAVVAAVMLFSFAQWIRLALQIEQNTREASEACQRLANHLCGVEREA